MLADPSLPRGTVIAIDGPAASGKGSLSRRLARHFGFAYLDTGLLYRAIGQKLLQQGVDLSDSTAAVDIACNLGFGDLRSAILRDDDIAHAAGVVAAHPDVRKALYGLQQRFAAQPPGGAPGTVLDGRDIGTVICPDAQIKIFIEASIQVRARRRHKELQARGLNSIYTRTLRDMRERDARDQSRAIAPLVPADDACVLDTTEVDEDSVFRSALAFISSRTPLNSE